MDLSIDCKLCEVKVEVEGNGVLKLIPLRKHELDGGAFTLCEHDQCYQELF